MSRLLAFVLAALRRSLWLGAMGLIGLALYVSLGRQLVPLAAEYRQEVQGKARDMLNMPVALGQLEGRWEGLSPQLVAHNVILGEGDGAVRLDRLALVPDVSGSLLARQLKLDSIELSGLQLGLVQTAEGEWRVDGLPERDDQSPADMSKLITQLQRIGRLRLLDSQITVEAREEAPLTLTYANFELRSTGQRLGLDGRLLLPDGQPLKLHAEAQVMPNDWLASEAELYLSLPQSDWAAWLPSSLSGSWNLAQLQAGGEVWLDWRQHGLFRAVARLNAPSVQLGQQTEDPITVKDVVVNAYLDRASEGYRLQFDGLAFTFDDDRWRESTLVVNQNMAEGSWHLQADRIAVAPVAELVKALLPLPELASGYVLGLAPSGTLRNLSVDYRPAVPGDDKLAFSSNLDAVSIDAHRWIPAVRNVSGAIKGNLGGGELRFDNDDFSLHLAQLFPRPWDYHRARGRLHWSLNDQAFTLSAPYLQVEGEEGHIAGDFLIRLMRDPAAEDYMDLRVGLSDGDARFTEKYLPTRSPALSPALTEWLTTAIRGGTVEQGYFQYQGALAGDAAETARSLSLYFKVKEAELAFQPGWPMLRDGSGEVLIENTGVQVRLAEARLLDSRVHDATAAVARQSGGQAPQLSIDGQVEGHLRDALTVMQVAPIGTGALFAGWRGEGPLSGRLRLAIPLTKGQSPHVDAEFSTSDAALFIRQADLQISSLGGNFRYDSERGFSATAFKGRTLDSVLKGRAFATGEPGMPATRIEATGTVGVASLLKWQKITQPVPASGELPLKMTLSVSSTDARLQFDSSLLGTELALPLPFGKTAEQRRDTTLRMTLGGERQRYTLRYDGLAALAFTAPSGNWAEGGGELVLGGASANLRNDQGLYVRGSVPQLDLGQWQAFVNQYRGAPAATGNGTLLRRAQLDISAFTGFGTQIDELHIDLKWQPTGWLLGLQSETVAGTVSVPDDAGKPIAVDLSRLRFPRAEPGEASVTPEDLLADVDPHGLPAVDVSVAQLLRGEELLGAGTLKIRPADYGVAFLDLDLNLKGLKFGGAGGWDGVRTWYKGRLQGDNLADVLQAWGYAPSTTSESFRLDVDGDWPGSPAFFALNRFSGGLDARLRKGQLREVDGGAQALRVFGLLNFDSIGRRLRLDFSDLFSKGLSYDRIKAKLQATNGVYVTTEPLTVAGPSSNLELDGQLDLVDDRIDAKLLVTLPLSNNLPLAALIVGAPAIGGALFVADKLLGDRVARFATVQYNVEGPWRAPEISFDKPFEDPN
ncbi:YhdP family protein [Stutzerimonas zhaodongensis]|uniref:YhdP family protein n=1 Tax=Stutzerimonas TaxID=2901164 RepID=UPI00388F8E14